MIRQSDSEPFCIVGAGSSGLAVLKNLRAAGIPCECLEKNPDLGGIWNYGSPGSSVYRSTHLISSKRQTEYTDFPMPGHYPPYPSVDQVGQYLRDYADHFQLREAIEFDTPVAQVERDPNGGWRVRLADGQTRHYRGVIIANGHNWDPNWPTVPGSFSGEVLHSAQYKTPDQVAGRRVLVVGAGNSGCDIAVEAAQHAERTFQSMRRGYHYLPKFLLGRPIDSCGEQLLRWRVPLWLRRWLVRRSVGFAIGTPEQYGLPAADHKLFETHPIVNSQMLYFVGHGRIGVKPGLAELCGDRVRFTDGSEERVDTIIYATGFKISFPFIDLAELDWKDGAPDLYLNLFHRQRDDLFVAGLIQPDSGQWGLVDYQGQVIARYLTRLASNDRRALRLQQRKRHDRPRLNGGVRYVHSARHRLEVEHFSYRRRLQKLLASLR